MPAATIDPARRVLGRLRVPGDKSISHRYALLAALAEGPSRLSGYAPGADCGSTLACLRNLGVDIVAAADGAVTLMGRGFGGLRSSAGPLDAGNSGTTMRMLAGILAGQPFTSTLFGDASLSRRPMRRVIEPLERMGARIESTDGHAPLTIHGGPLQPIAHSPAVPSAQVKSAVLLAALFAEGTTRSPSRRRRATTPSRRCWRSARTSGAGADRVGRRRAATDRTFDGDPRGLLLRRVLDGRGRGAPRLARSRSRTSGSTRRESGWWPCCAGSARASPSRSTSVDAGEPRGTISVEGDRTGTVDISPEEVPGLIDELPAIAALAAHGGEVTVRGAGELRVKESDRIATLVAGFRSLGIAADERPDGFTVHGTGAPRGGVADAHGDHRMAMAFAIAALARRGPSTIDGAEAVAISYPGFFETLDRLVA